MSSHPARVPGLSLALGLFAAPLVAGPLGDDPFPRATPESQGLSTVALAELVEELESYIERDILVGAELLVIQNRRTVLHETFGHSDRDEGAVWAPLTVCNIRSMTKPLTGAAAQILVDRGELSLDEPMAKYLPGFDTDAARQITVRQVISHRAGLPLTILTALDEYPTLLDMGNAVGARGPEFEPESRFWYSDSGTDALGALVEVVSGKTLDAFVHEQLLAPLGMTDSFYFLDDEDPRRSSIASLYAGGVGHWARYLDPDDGVFYPYAWGSQSLYSTTQDYARFLAMWMDAGRVGDRVVLSPAAVERSLTPVSAMSMLGSEARFPTSFSGLEVCYGQMSVLHVPQGGLGTEPATIIGHSGSDGTIAWAWPERDLMILCFTQSRGGGLMRLEGALDRLIVNPDAYTGDDVPPADLVPFLGTYVADWAHHMKEELTVDVRGGELTLDVPSQMVFELVPDDDQAERWSFAIAPQIRVWFERDAMGVVDCLRIEQGPLVFEAPRVGTAHLAEFTAANKPDPEVLGKYFGSYHDPEQDEHVEVLIDGDYLGIRRPEGQTFHLWKVPVEDAWQVRESPLVVITFQERDGRVVSFTRHGAGDNDVVFPRAGAEPDEG